MGSFAWGQPFAFCFFFKRLVKPEDANKCTSRFCNLQRQVEIVATNSVKRNIKIVGTLLPGMDFIVYVIVGSKAQYKIPVACRRSSGNVCAQVFGDLYAKMTNTTCCSMYQYTLPFNYIGIFYQCLVCGEGC